VSAHEELERQLLRSVATRSWARNGPLASFARWWHAGIGHGRATATLVVVLVLGAAVVTGVGDTGRSISAASRSPITPVLTSRCGLCRTLGGQLHGPMAGEQASTEDRGGSSSARERRGLSAVVWSRSAAKA
jgi:hypothetical protein